MKEKIENFLNKLLARATFKSRTPVDPAAPRYADLNDRVFAAALDIVVLYVLLYPLFHAMELRIFRRVDAEKLHTLNTHDAPSLIEIIEILWHANYLPLWLLNTAAQFFIIGVIIVLVQVKFGATPGKYLLGLRIATAKDHTTPAAWRYALRCAAYLPAALIGMVGIFWISFNKERRGWHDYIAGTVVLHTRPRGWYWQHIKQGYRWLRARLT